MEKDPAQQWKSMGKTREVFHTPIFSVAAEEYKCLYSGVQRDFFTIQTCNWVTVVPETPDGKLLMVRQFRHGTKTVELEFPGGCIDDSDADPVAAAVRELREETGYTGEVAGIIGHHRPNPAILGNTCYVVLVKNVRKTDDTAFDSAEYLLPELHDYEDVRRKFTEGVIDHALMIDAFFFYSLHRGK